MATQIVGKPARWSGSRDAEGHRDYRLTFKVRGDYTDGPARVMQTPGLPLPGAWWIVDNDVDLWAWARWDLQVEQFEGRDEKHQWWLVHCFFSTKPPDARHGRGAEGGSTRPREHQAEDPLLEAPKVSGSFTKVTKEQVTDRFGLPLLTSSFEQIRGAQAEFDEGRASVRVEQNVTALGLDVAAAMFNTVNAYALWGFLPRCVKLSGVSWDRKFFGPGYVYYTRHLDFEVDPNTFDRLVPDQGSLALNGRWRTPGDPLGSGCTLNTTASPSPGGPVVSATVVAGGTGYQANAIIPLQVTGGGGSGAVVLAQTNASGVVTAVTYVYKGGSGYISLNGAATADFRGWMINSLGNDAGGNPVFPDPGNPAAPNFVRYKDRQGNQAVAQLNGLGVPLGGFTPPAIADTQGVRIIQRYPESDFALLGIPVLL